MSHPQEPVKVCGLCPSYNDVPLGFFTADSAGRILRGNPALGSLLGKEALSGGKNWSHYFEVGSWEALNAELSAYGKAQIQVFSPDLSKAYKVNASSGRRFIEGSIEEITEAVTTNRMLAYLASHDQLTGVLSRNAIAGIVQDAIDAAGDTPTDVLACMDLNRFKTVNDLYGHAIGDAVITKVCERIQHHLNGKVAYAIGRIGGDEFLILMLGVSLDTATTLCKGITSMLESNVFQERDLVFKVGASLGIVGVTAGAKLEDLMSVADRACREAKKDSSNVFAYGAHERAFLELEEEKHLVSIMTPEQVPSYLALCMQPIMSMHTPYSSLDFETLVRAKDKNGKDLPTGRVINIAEAHGRVGMIDRWVVKSALEWIDASIKHLSATRFITVNLSGASVNDERCMADIYAMLRNHPQAASVVCIEITEGVALRDFAKTCRVIEQLRNYNVRLALDDFGAGYTSFTYLSDLQADALKIDGALVIAAAQHSARLSIIRAIADLTRNLGMQSIAEWVEDVETLRAMSEAGIDYVQGFGIARPMQPQEILRGEHAASWVDTPDMKKAVALLQHEHRRQDDGKGTIYLPQFAFQ